MSTGPSRPPSGEQYWISHESATACVTQVGATLRTFTVDGRDVIDGFTVDERAIDSRGQVLAPWPNRLARGEYAYGGRRLQCPLTEPGRSNAIHGLVRWLDWALVARDESSVTLSCALRPQPGYEWHLELVATYTLGPDGLTVLLTAVNVGTARAPWGAGFHPYLTAGDCLVDDLELQVPATRVVAGYAQDGEPTLVPSGRTDLDFQALRVVGDRVLDTAYGGLVRDEDGRATVQVRRPGSGPTFRLWLDAAFRYVMVYSGDGASDPRRRRRSLAIEPMTCPPEAFRSGCDLVELDPGERWTGSWGLATG